LRYYLNQFFKFNAMGIQFLRVIIFFQNKFQISPHIVLISNINCMTTEETTPEIDNTHGTSEASQQEVTPEVAIKDYIDKRAAAKKNLENKMSKQAMVDLIFKQNELLAQQSSQMLEIIDMANTIEKTSRDDEANKCGIVVQKNNTCAVVNDMYEKSIKIQIVLFILFVVVLLWLLYHYASSEQTK
jgi:hypothetical protein